MSVAKILAVTLSSIVAVFVALLAQSNFIRINSFNTVERKGVENCREIVGAEACEKLLLHRETGLVYLACSSVESRAQWTPAAPSFKSPDVFKDYVGLYNPSKPGPIKGLKLKGFQSSDPHNFGLHVHGMDIVPSSSDPKTLFVYLINHRPRTDRNEVEKGANSTIEIFTTGAGSDTLTHVRTVSDPSVLSTPNDVSGAADGKSFFFTNDHGQHKMSISHKLRSLFLNAAISTVGFCHVETGCKISASGIQGANGIVRTNEETIYVTESLGGYVKKYTQQADNELVLVDQIKIGRSLDNIVADEKGNLFVAGFVSIVKMIQHFADPVNHQDNPSSIYKISLNTGQSAFFGEKYNVTKIWEDDGSLGCAASTGVYDAGRSHIYIGGVMCSKTLDCKL